MSIINMLFYVLVGLVLGARAISLSQLEQKFNTLKQEFDNLKQEQSDSKTQIVKVQNQLEYGGKKYQTLQYTTSTSQLKDHDYLMLQFLGAKGAWLGCAAFESDGNICILATCPSYNNNYYHKFDERCRGEKYQIIGEGTDHNLIKSGQQIRLRYLHEHNTWVSFQSGKCVKGTCSGTTSQGSNFNRCHTEIFRIYARGKRNGEIVYNDDVIMLYSDSASKYVSIQGENNGDATSFNFCPGVVPPAYLSYGICSKNAFRIYRKP